MIDLHSHTNASDGQHPVAVLLSLAHAAGVRTLSITDHDTVASIDAALSLAPSCGLEVIPGIEVSSAVDQREVHILGHFVNPADSRLAGFSLRLRREREERMEQMVEKARKLGFPITMEHVRNIAGDAHLARPHLARVFVQGGWCLDVREAFDRFLGDGKPAAVDKFRFPFGDAIELIHGAGGTATIAHPGVSKLERHDLLRMKDAGLDGVEVHHSDHPGSLRQKFLNLAAELELIPTAGSDFHGEEVAPNRHLGTASMNPDDFEKLRSRARPV